MRCLMAELNSIPGVFLAPSEDDLRRIWEACAREGLGADSAGALKLIMLAVEDSEAGVLGAEDEDDEELPDPLLNAARYLQENPEKVAAAAQAGVTTLKRLFAGLRKPM